jgi:hypothetical protein
MPSRTGRSQHALKTAQFYVIQGKCEGLQAIKMPPGQRQPEQARLSGFITARETSCHTTHIFHIHMFLIYILFSSLTCGRSMVVGISYLR